MNARKPDAQGVAAVAWEVKMPEAYAKPDHEAGLASWLIESKRFHPLWYNWTVNLIHLRDLPGVPPAKKHYPEAEYELLILALDPDSTPDPDDAVTCSKFLTPIDVVKQFHGITDKQAIDMVRAAVLCICHGRISPDGDYRQAWSVLIDNTIEHIRSGAHEPN